MSVVRIVVDPAFGADLYDLSRDAHVWICDSPDNSEAIHDVWKRDGSDPRVTSFPMSGPKVDALYGILVTVDEHHDEASTPDPWTSMEVFGLENDELDENRVSAALGVPVGVVQGGTIWFIERRGR